MAFEEIIAELDKKIGSLIQETLEKEAKSIENAIFKARIKKEFGILVVNGLADVSPLVPYGFIWYVSDPLKVGAFEEYDKGQ